jgi:lipopolysaccharide transport system permease protein
MRSEGGGGAELPLVAAPSIFGPASGMLVPSPIHDALFLERRSRGPIGSRMRDFAQFLSEIVTHRSLLGILVQRDLKIRYQALGLGYLWSLLNPFLMLAVYTFVFSVVLKSSIEDFIAFIACGILPWMWLQGSLTAGVHTIVSSGPLLRRRALPAQILPLVTVTSQLAHFLTGLPILFGIVLIYDRPLTPALLFLPILVVLQFVLTYGLTLIISTLAVRFRDLEYILANVLMLMFFLAPILYPWEFVPRSLQPILLLNPVTLLAHNYQNLLFFGRWPFWNEIWLLAAMACGSVILAFLVFDKRRYLFAEQV